MTVNKFNKIIYFFVVAFLVLGMFFARADVVRADADNIFWGGYESNVQLALGLGNEDPRQIVANVVNVGLGFIGIIAVMIIVMAGFKLMTTGGNEEALSDAKKMMSSGVIGLVIVLASFGIAQFVVNNLFIVTGAVE